MLYTIPNVDQALLKIGFVRCNEGLVYLRKVNHHVYPYHIFVGSPAYLFLELEKNVGLYTTDMFQKVTEGLMRIAHNSYTIQTHLYKTLIAETGDFFFHEQQLQKADQYENYHQYLIKNKI